MKLKSVGLKFTGAVKQATRKYPIKFLSSLEIQAKGYCVSVTMTGSGGGFQAMALVWLDRDRRHFLSTTGDTLPGTTRTIG